MGQETTDKAPSCIRWEIWILWGLFLVLVVYPLSIGPVWFTVSQLGCAMELRPQLEFFYFPILYLCDVCPPALDLLRWYFELWGK